MIPISRPADRHSLGAEEAVLEVMRSGRWVGGQVVEQAEYEAARLFGRTFAVGVASGTDALMLALQASGLGPGNRVGIPDLSFYATAGAILAIGAQPVFFDVTDKAVLDEDQDFTVVDAVVPVQLFGNSCGPLAATNVVDDGAQAAGRTDFTGRLTATSTYPTKTWGGPGDGGFVLGDDPELLRRVRLLGSHGAVERDHHVSIEGATGRTSRLSALAAAHLVEQAKTFDDRTRRRRRIAAYYDENLSSSLRPLHRDAGNPVPTYNIRSPQRDRVRTVLAHHGVQTAVYYPRRLSEQPACRADVVNPVAQKLSQELFAVPVHAGLSDAEVDTIVSALKSV